MYVSAFSDNFALSFFGLFGATDFVSLALVRQSQIDLQ